MRENSPEQPPTAPDTGPTAPGPVAVLWPLLSQKGVAEARAITEALSGAGIPQNCVV